LWHRSEYEKLPEYDEGAMPPAIGLFLCHQTNATGRETVCRGWLTVAADSIAVRIALARGTVTMAQRDAEVVAPLHAAGEDACRAGLKGIKRPGRKALTLIEKLIAKGAGKPG
jgi:hypothetical protein